MYKCKKMLCLLIAALVLLTSPMALTAAAEETVTDAPTPLTVQVEMSKSAYFITSKAKATVRLKNTSDAALRDVSVSAFSEKHLLPKGSESCLLIPELEAGQTAEYRFEMMLDRKNAGVSFPERVLLFFVQLFRTYEPMQSIVVPLPDYAAGTQNTVCTQEISFRHGSTNAVLNVYACYRTETGSPVGPVDPVPRPQVTYLDKYVVDILESGTYTIQMETQDDETPVQVTMYVQGDSRAIEIPVGGMLAQNINLPSSLSNVGKIRVIVKNMNSSPKAYVVFSNVGYMEMEDVAEAADMLKEAGGGDIRQQLQIDRLQYCGVSFGLGYVCESYTLPEENLQYNFYFTQTTGYTGIVRWDVIDRNDSQNDASMVLRLHDKVTDSKAFTVSGKKMDPSELEGLFS